MKTQKAFTLIELLVVISIIALLMSILMPSLKAVKEQAQELQCMSNLRNIGTYWYLYSSDYDGSFNVGWPRTEGSNYWTRALEDYYGGRGNMDIFCCPKADKMPEIPTGYDKVYVNFRTFLSDRF